MLQQHIQASLPPGTELNAIDYSEEKALASLYHYMTKPQVGGRPALRPAGPR